MAGGWLTKRILMVREATHGTIPTNPVCLEFLSESFDLKETQASEDINLLGGAGEASPMAFGTSTFSGAVGLVASTDNMPVIMTHVVGAATATVAATATAWAATTAYTVGDKENHSDGKHTLVCYAAGTSGATEPTVQADPNDDRGVKVVDGTVTWIVMPKLMQYTFSRQQKIPSFTIEYELEDEAGALFYKRFSNVYMNTLPMAMAGGTISLKVSGDFMAATSANSTQAGYTKLSAMVGAKIVPAFKDFYGYDDCTVTLDSVADCGIESINLDITRNVMLDNAINNCKIPNIGVTSIKGAMNRVFDTTEYSNDEVHLDKSIVFDFEKANGCQTTVTFPLVRPKLADPVQTIDKQAFMNVELSAYGTSATPSVSAVVIAPGLFDSTGAIVGTGVY